MRDKCSSLSKSSVPEESSMDQSVAPQVEVAEEQSTPCPHVEETSPSSPPPQELIVVLFN